MQSANRWVTDLVFESFYTDHNDGVKPWPETFPMPGSVFLRKLQDSDHDPKQYRKLYAKAKDLWVQMLQDNQMDQDRRKAFWFLMD